MSLVSCVIGKISWYGRASDLEFEMQQIGEVLNFYTKQVTSLADNIVKVDERIDSLFSKKQQYMNMAYSVNPTDKDTYSQMITSMQTATTAINQQMLTYRQQRSKLEYAKSIMHNKEKALQNKKMQTETQLKIAQQMGPAFEKMEDAAIKRFAPKI